MATIVTDVSLEAGGANSDAAAPRPVLGRRPFGRDRLANGYRGDRSVSVGPAQQPHLAARTHRCPERIELSWSRLIVLRVRQPHRRRCDQRPAAGRPKRNLRSSRRGRDSCIDAPESSQLVRGAESPVVADIPRIEPVERTVPDRIKPGAQGTVFPGHGHGSSPIADCLNARFRSTVGPQPSELIERVLRPGWGRIVPGTGG